ncbi:protein kinase domain-containing protein [Streptomyces sp. cg40]|uniref:protein kinase domain-containing protein n=1 Tax=Streptomyces sp. cg40 TaxID=3419764 RepID=UPI003D0644DD
MKPLEAGDPASVGDGRYRLVGRLGRGGMGVVYFGRSRSGRAVAVKVVRPELSTEPGFRRRFADEVDAARRVGGFHTAPVVDADPQGEPAWLVTAYVPGPTLQVLLDRVGPLPADTLTVLAAGLAEALTAIHRAGVIHRDLKPANIIVAEDGPRVIDFGIARALDGTALTQTGFQIGTLGFLSPEQLTGGTLTPAVDMFALGVVLCQAAGRAPFGDGVSAAWPYRVVHEQPDLTDVPRQLRELVAACLAKDPRDRPDPSEFLDRLTVRHPSDLWLPAEATAIVRSQDPAAAHVAPPDRPPSRSADPRTALSGAPVAGEGLVVAGDPVAGERPVVAADAGAVVPGVSGVGERWVVGAGPGLVAPGAPVVGERSVVGADGGSVVPGLPVAGEWSAEGVDPGAVAAGEPVAGERSDVAAGLRPVVTDVPTADGGPSAVGAPAASAGGQGMASHPPTVQSSPGPGFGPARVFVPAPVPPGGASTVGGAGPVGGVRARRGRGRTAAVAALLVAAATAGLLVWHPWSGSRSGSGQDDAGAGASSSASSSARRSTSAAFPDAPLLVRMDTDPGSSTCHSVIGRRDSTTDHPKQLIDGTCDALPQWSPDHKSFAFTRKTADGSAVWTANADGTGLRRIAAVAGGRVAWSPDGGRLAVLRRADGVQQLFVVNVSDGSAQQLTTGSGAVEDPAWSPDGKHIAVCLQKTSGWQIHVVDPSRPGAEPRQVTHQSRRALDPVWSPDGRYFAYTAGAPGVGTGGDIHIVKVDGTDDRTLVRTAAQEMDPVWSPDGKWVAFVRGPFDRPVIWAVRADGTGLRRLTTGSTPEGHPSWR